jgi:phosphohistidine phosphatase
MKTLYLIRHAKSSWDDLSLKDFDRPLTGTGIKKTNKIIQFLTERKVCPELIISSPAVRAFETARLIAKGIGHPEEKIVTEAALYDSSADDYIEIIENVRNEISSVMIFGHNPTITYAANSFLKKATEMIPTSGIVNVTFDTDKWSEVRKAKVKKESVIFPKMLK